MLPARDMDRMRTETATEETMKTMAQLLMDPPPELVDMFDRFLAEHANRQMLDEAPPMPPMGFERPPMAGPGAPSMGPPDVKKMAQLQNLKGKLGG